MLNILRKNSLLVFNSFKVLGGCFYSSFLMGMLMLVVNSKVFSLADFFFFLFFVGSLGFGFSVFILERMRLLPDSLITYRYSFLGYLFLIYNWKCYL